MEQTVQNHRSKKRMILTFCIGLVFIILVLWGLVSLGLGIAGLFSDGEIYVGDMNTEDVGASWALKSRLEGVEPESAEYFEAVLDRFVMQDMPTFNNVNDLDSEYIISYGLWQVISMNGSEGVLAVDEDEKFYRVPKELVEKMALYYVNYGESFKHKNLDLCGTFKYNRLNGTYEIPLSYPNDYLIPKVVDVQLDAANNTATVTVDCYQYNDVDMDPRENETNFRKREVYVLKKVATEDPIDQQVEPTHYQIVSMKQVEKLAETPAESEENNEETENTEE